MLSFMLEDNMHDNILILLTLYLYFYYRKCFTHDGQLYDFHATMLFPCASDEPTMRFSKRFKPSKPKSWPTYY